MKRHLLGWAVGVVVVGCGGAPEAGEARLAEGRAGYTECGRAACGAGYEATFIHLASCEPASAGELNATECTALQAGGVRNQVDDEPPEPIKAQEITDPSSDPVPNDKPPEPIK